MKRVRARYIGERPIIVIGQGRIEPGDELEVYEWEVRPPSEGGRGIFEPIRPKASKARKTEE